jgi:hypothetical protein
MNNRAAKRFIRANVFNGGLNNGLEPTVVHLLKKDQGIRGCTFKGKARCIEAAFSDHGHVASGIDQLAIRKSAFDIRVAIYFFGRALKRIASVFHGSSSK